MLVGQEIEVNQIHLAVDLYLAALAAAWPGQPDRVEVIDFFGRDEALVHFCCACADMLTARTRSNIRRVADSTRLFASYLIEKSTNAACEKPRSAAACPSASSTKVKDHMSERLANEISVGR